VVPAIHCCGFLYICCGTNFSLIGIAAIVMIGITLCNITVRCPDSSTKSELPSLIKVCGRMKIQQSLPSRGQSVENDQLQALFPSSGVPEKKPVKFGIFR
jgi:hypothetical protein